MFRSRRHSRDLEFAVDLFVFAIDTLHELIIRDDIEEADNVFELTEKHIVSRINDETVYDFEGATCIDKLHKLFESCNNALFIYRLLILNKRKQYEEMLSILVATKDDPLELDSDQAETLSTLSYNIAVEMFHTRSFENAIVWSKFSYSFGKFHFPPET